MVTRLFLKASLSHPYYNLSKSYLRRWFFQIKFKMFWQFLNQFILEFHNAVISFIPKIRKDNADFTLFAYDNSILLTHENPQLASGYLQNDLDRFQHWMRKRRVQLMKLNQFTSLLPSGMKECPPVSLDNNLLTEVESVIIWVLTLVKSLHGK